MDCPECGGKNCGYLGVEIRDSIEGSRIVDVWRCFDCEDYEFEGEPYTALEIDPFIISNADIITLSDEDSGNSGIPF